MPQRMYAYQCNGRSTIGEGSLPPILVAALQSSPPRIFFLRLTVDFVDPYTGENNLSTTYVKEMAYPTSQLAELIRLAKVATTDILHELVGSHVQVLRDLSVQIVDCAIGMVTDPDHAEHRVLPMEIHLSCIALSPAESPIDVYEEEHNLDQESEDEEPDELLVMGFLVDAVLCTVCQEEMEAQSIAARIPCHHLFHEMCIKNWLTYNPSCPNCRFPLC